MTTSIGYTEERPWGSFTILNDQQYCKVKSITVAPGGKLSLQSHKYRKEVWTIVSGTGTITIGETIKVYTVGETAIIECGEKHRIENSTTEPVIFIEVQTGTYFGEDDIFRYEDMYRRTN